MANLVFNISKGRVVEYYNRVENNDPAASRISLVVVDSTETDDAMRDTDSLSALLALTNCAEVTNTNYARIHLTDTELAALPAPDDTGNKYDVDLPDQTWSSIAAGDGWTDLVICYDPLGTNVDANMIPLTLHDFIVTPDGSDITVQFAAQGFFSAT